MGGGNYTICNHCGNTKNEDSIFRCDDCGMFFCMSCSQFGPTKDDPYGDDHILCPNCDSNNYSMVGEISNESNLDKEIEIQSLPTPEVTNNKISINESKAIIYCENCGVIPGERIECLFPKDHKFTVTQEFVYCKNCGVTPGARTECIFPKDHKFIIMEDFVYCKICGATPGPKSNCIFPHDHKFITQKI